MQVAGINRDIAVQAVVEDGYRIFSSYQLQEPLDVCTECCMDPEAERSLAGMAVRSIPRDLLAEYHDGAHSSKTDVQEVKHFLPRYLDLISRFEFPSHSIEISLSRLMPFDTAEWQPLELDVLHWFARSYFRSCLAVYPLPVQMDQIDSILIMFHQGGFRVKGLLEAWASAPTKSSILHLRDLVFHGLVQLDRVRLSNSFADRELALTVSTWILSMPVRERFCSAIEQWMVSDGGLNDEEAEALSLLYEVLRAG